MESEQKKKPFRILIPLVLVLLLLVSAAGVMAMQQENRKALQQEGSAAEISAEMKGAVEAQAAASEEELAQMAARMGLDMEYLTPQEQEALISGDFSREDVLDFLLKKKEQQVAEEKLREEAAQASVDPSEDPEVQRIISEVYALRGSYVGQLNSLAASAKSEFAALPAEQQTEDAKNRIISEKMAQGSSLEGSCDAQMGQLVGQLRSRLTEIGAGTGLADQVYSTYVQEKQLKRSYYVSAYS